MRSWNGKNLFYSLYQIQMVEVGVVKECRIPTNMRWSGLRVVNSWQLCILPDCIIKYKFKYSTSTKNMRKQQAEGFVQPHYPSAPPLNRVDEVVVVD